MIALLSLVSAAFGEDSAIDAAYRKEFAYLAAEERELQARLAELDATSAQALTDAEAELETLERRLIALTHEADAAEDALAGVERERTAVDDAAAVLQTTVTQASEELGLPPVTGDPAGAVPALFEAAARAVEAGGARTWTDGDVFLADGRAVDARVYQFGRVGAWGVTSTEAGSLAPAGEGRLQLRSVGGATARALAQGATPPVLDLVLFEAEAGVADAEKGGGLGQLLDDAGTMGKLLFGLGCVSAALVVVRGITLALARRGGEGVIAAVEAAILGGDHPRALAAVGRRHTPVARTLGAILDAADRPEDERLRVVDAALLREAPRIDRFASALVVITAGSPLLGLLGTVTGMIATFDVITEHGTGNPKLLSAGIAEALVCTALGLAVAIPTLLAGNVLASVAAAVHNTLDRGALRVLDALARVRRTP